MASRLRGLYRGHEVVVELRTMERRKTPLWELYVEFRVSSSPFQLEVYRESALSRVGKFLRLTREVQVGDPRFDATYVVKMNGDPSGMYRQYLFDSEMCAKISEIFDKHGLSLLKLETDRLWGVKVLEGNSESSPPYGIRPELLQEMTHFLAAFAQKVEKLGFAELRG